MYLRTVSVDSLWNQGGYKPVLPGLLMQPLSDYPSTYAERKEPRVRMSVAFEDAQSGDLAGDSCLQLHHLMEEMPFFLASFPCVFLHKHEGQLVACLCVDFPQVLLV